MQGSLTINSEQRLVILFSVQKEEQICEREYCLRCERVDIEMKQFLMLTSLRVKCVDEPSMNKS